jgi:hypothetical protein
MGEDLLGATGEPVPYTGEDEETIADRLRGLGYVE